MPSPMKTRPATRPVFWRRVRRPQKSRTGFPMSATVRGSSGPTEGWSTEGGDGSGHAQTVRFREVGPRVGHGGSSRGRTKPTLPGQLASSAFPSPPRRRYASGPVLDWLPATPLRSSALRLARPGRCGASPGALREAPQFSPGLSLSDDREANSVPGRSPLTKVQRRPARTVNRGHVCTATSKAAI